LIERTHIDIPCLGAGVVIAAARQRIRSERGLRRQGIGSPPPSVLWASGGVDIIGDDFRQGGGGRLH
jgi:hypothetical protein